MKIGVLFLLCQKSCKTQKKPTLDEKDCNVMRKQQADAGIYI